MKEYQVLEYDVNSPADKSVSVPLDSVYGLAVKVIKDGEPVALSGDELSVGGQTGQGEAGGYGLFVLSSGSEPGAKLLDVEVSKSSGETYDFENTINVRQPIDRTTRISMNLGTFLSGYEVSPSNVKLFQMTSTITPDAGGDPITETYDIDDLQFYGKTPVVPTQTWWHVANGQWEDQAKTYRSDSLTLGVVGTRNVIAYTNNQYPKSAGTATFKLVFKFGDGEDLNAEFKLVVREKDMGYIDTFN